MIKSTSPNPKNEAEVKERKDGDDSSKESKQRSPWTVGIIIFFLISCFFHKKEENRDAGTAGSGQSQTEEKGPKTKDGDRIQLDASQVAQTIIPTLVGRTARTTRSVSIASIGSDFDIDADWG